METRFNESEWGWFVDLEHNELTIYKPSLPTIHEYEYSPPKYIVDGYYDLENNETKNKGYTETNAYTIYKPSIPIIHEYHLQIFMNGHVIREISIPWTKVEQVIQKIKMPWSDAAGNFGALFMVFMLYSLYKYHAM